MIPVEQHHPADPARADGLSAEGRQGDCLRACIASVTEVDYCQVPHFAEMGADWWDAWRAWSQTELGLDVGTLVPVDGRIAQFVDGDPADLVAIACGPSPRRPGVRHAIVVDGHLAQLHDPHPSRAGLDRIDELYLFVPVRDPSPMAAAVT